VTTYAYIQDPEPHAPTTEEREHIDRFIAAFVAKKGGPPAGTWRVPRVGYCHFMRTRLHWLERP
jgi:hypothetical protein